MCKAQRVNNIVAEAAPDVGAAASQQFNKQETR
jgi:hypothetical protein